MQILITNDDGYKAKGIKVLAGIMNKIGNVTVVGPKRHQSGMGLAVDLGLKQLAYRNLGTIDGASWSYLDATPASCAKFGINFMVPGPEVVISGINHGSNATTGACYSGTLGACQEAAICGIPAIGVSIDTMNPNADMSAIEVLFPSIFWKLMNDLPQRYGIYYNVNFPDLPLSEIKGVRITPMGLGRWVKEFTDWDPDYYHKLGIRPGDLGQPEEPKCEEGEKLYMMIGQYIDSPDDSPESDHHMLKKGYVTITCHNFISTDFPEIQRLKDNGLEEDF